MCACACVCVYVLIICSLGGEEESLCEGVRERPPFQAPGMFLQHRRREAYERRPVRVSCLCVCVCVETLGCVFAPCMKKGDFL